MQITRRNLDITYLTLPYSKINAHFIACGVVDFYQFFLVLFGHLTFIVWEGYNSDANYSREATHYYFLTLSLFLKKFFI